MDFSNFYPKTVYFCNCLTMVIEKCKKGSSLQNLCDEINKNDTDDVTIYCSKCGDAKQDVVFSCGNHMQARVIQIVEADVTLHVTEKHFCLNCIKRYLRDHYSKFSSKVNI